MPAHDIPACQGPDRNPHPPRFTPPRGATDTHAHVFGPSDRYPWTPDRSYTPPDSPFAEYMALLDTLGLDRGVIVQPSVYGTDNRATLDALRAAPGRLRGVAVVDADVPDAELDEMHRLGVRGVRFNLLYRGGVAYEAAERLARRIGPMGWHIQFLIDISAVEGFASMLAALPVPVVIDHIGHMNADKGVDHPAFRDLLAMLGDGRTWVKLSGAYRVSASDTLPFADVAAAGARAGRGAAGPDGLGQRLAASLGDAADAERRRPAGPAGRLGAGRGHARPYPSRQSSGALQLPGRGRRGMSAPRHRTPAGACDTHAHVFGPESRYPYSGGRGYTPPDASLADWLALHETLGVTRGVLTQPSVYGVDNQAILDAVALHPDRLRAVVAVNGGISDAELKRLDAEGARGIRINLADKGGMPFDSIDEVAQFARRLEPLGWHVELLVHVDEMDMGAFRDFPVDVVIGHYGYMPAAKGPDDPGFRAMLALMEGGRAWVKMTAPYRITDREALPFDDVEPLARALVAARPDRLIWGSDWPHPHIRTKATSPDDVGMFNQLMDWLGDDAVRRQVLVENPAGLYRFG